MDSQFARDTAVNCDQQGIWHATMRKGWRIGEALNGGYVLAVAGRVLREALPHDDPLSINAFYLAPVMPGPVRCEVTLLRSSRSTTQAVLKMYQNNTHVLQVTAAYTDLNKLTGPSWAQQQAPKIKPPAECSKAHPDFFEMNQNVNVHLTEGMEVFAGKGPSGTGAWDGWVSFTDGADPDPLALLLFADAFPPPVFTVMGVTGWVPTIELTVQLRATPAPGPIQARMRTRYITKGVVEEDGEFWDSSGNLVAVSRQCAKVRLPKTD
ncbi:MAG: hypothetical protein CSA53_02465 [Gammaproteobacteria bacterium]|nr:MAG: hypothetical protein CSA53_02465 [Gammaproteobacteria bacterium]